VALTAIFAAEGDESGFQPPTVNHSFFYDAVGDGSIIASWKVVALLVIGTVGLILFFTLSARKASVVPSKVSQHSRRCSTDQGPPARLRSPARRTSS
jgi:F-type H+-transporting ATPase subunit a